MLLALPPPSLFSPLLCPLISVQHRTNHVIHLSLMSHLLSQLSRLHHPLYFTPHPSNIYDMYVLSPPLLSLVSRLLPCYSTLGSRPLVAGLHFPPLHLYNLASDPTLCSILFLSPLTRCLLCAVLYASAFGDASYMPALYVEPPATSSRAPPVPDSRLLFALSSSLAPGIHRTSPPQSHPLIAPPCYPSPDL